MNTRRCALFALLSLLCATSSFAQTGASSAYKATNVRTGEFISADVAAGSVTLRSKVGATTVYHFTDKTDCLRAKSSASPTDFKPGEMVVVRFRPSTSTPPILYDLTDKPSWEWLFRLRHVTTPVVLQEVNDDGWLKVTEGADSAQFRYRTTEKTQWSKSGKSVGPSDFKTGDKVWVVPRLLPGGSTMATVVSDAREDAGKMKERVGSTVTGVVAEYNNEKRSLSLHTVSGDDRTILLQKECLVRQNGTDVPIASLKPGRTVTVHLKLNEEGDRLATRITIQNGRKQSGKRVSK